MESHFEHSETVLKPPETRSLRGSFDSKLDANFFDTQKPKSRNIKECRSDTTSPCSKPNPESLRSKWYASKEAFFDFPNPKVTDASLQLTIKKPGSVVIKEGFIETPKLSQISKSFHGMSSADSSFLNTTNVPRRASDGSSFTSKNKQLESSFYSSESFDKEVPSPRPQLVSRTSLPGSFKSLDSNSKSRKSSGSKTRFTTTLVDEEEPVTRTCTASEGNIAVLQMASKDHQYSSNLNIQDLNCEGKSEKKDVSKLVRSNTTK